jgi:hypothetical protein
MKIIKPGRKQRGWSKKLRCTGSGNGGGGCGAVLLVSELDIYWTYTSYLGERGTYRTFCCISCGVETDISESTSVSPKGKRPTDEERNAIALKRT